MAGNEKPASEHVQEAFARGSGPIEVLLFSDYFCPACRNMEPYLEETLPELVNRGVKVSFVDSPYSQRSSLHVRYFLYAAMASPLLESVMHARNVLFDLADEDRVESEPDILLALKENNVQIEFFDTQPLMKQWMGIIEKYDVRHTPTCVIVRPEEEAGQYIGSREITEALDRLLDELSSKSLKASD